MGLELNNTPDGDINSLVKDLYQTLIIKRLGLGAIRRLKDPDKLEAAMLEIAELNEDYEGLIKMQTAYNKFMKSTGEKQDNPKELQDLISKVRTNVGSIVSQIPKVNTDGI